MKTEIMSSIAGMKIMNYIMVETDAAKGIGSKELLKKLLFHHNILIKDATALEKPPFDV